MLKRIRTGLYASLFTAAFFSILLSASLGALAAKGSRQINCFFEQPGADAEASDPVKNENGTDKTGVTNVIPGGMPFGVKLYTGGPVAAEFAQIETESGKVCPAHDAGFVEGDVITEVGGIGVSTAEEVVRAIESSNGETKIKVLRDGEQMSFTVSPVRCKDGKQRIGLLIKECTAGIGTVTFITPDTGEFMGLGHGICDDKTGDPVPLIRGVVTDVQITGAEKGKSGDPGELKGTFTDKNVGVIRKNTESGVVGFFKDKTFESAETIEIGAKEELTVGDAYILSTVEPGEPKMYSIRIENVSVGTNSKNFELKITDPDLIEETGGIVQGMSGSPVIQNGKLVGAVTHVMINDPVRGYGIFIDEMLKETKI